MLSRTAVYLILVHTLLTSAGVMMHLKAHDPAQSLFFWWAAPVSLFNLVVVTLLYLHPRTVAWGVLANGISVAYGVIGMSYFSIKTMVPPYSAGTILLKSTAPFILLLLAKLPLGALIFREVSGLPDREKER